MAIDISQSSEEIEESINISIAAEMRAPGADFAAIIEAAQEIYVRGEIAEGLSAVASPFEDEYDVRYNSEYDATLAELPDEPPEPDCVRAEIWSDGYEQGYADAIEDALQEVAVLGED